MVRGLLIILAILVAVLGAVLDASLLYLVSAALVIAAGIAWLLRLKGKFDISKPDSVGYSAVAEEDLGSLGILDIRPKSATHNGSHTEPIAAPLEEDDASAGRQVSMFDERDSIAEAVAVEDEVSIEETSVPSRSQFSYRQTESRAGAPVRERHERSSSGFPVSSVAAPLDPSVFAPFLESLCAALKANTVCLVSSEAKEGNSRIDAIVSRNAYARSAGSNLSKNGLPWSGNAPRKVRVERISESEWTSMDLKYYREEIAVKEFAYSTVPVSAKGERYTLIVDSMKEGVLDGVRSSRILDQCARLLAVIIEQPGPLANWEQLEAKPRREIIGEEIRRARAEGRQLALALIMLNRAADVALNDRDRMAEAEETLRHSISLSAEGLRVEKFGDLMYGAFYSGNVSAVESWALAMRDSLAKQPGLPEGGVSVGVAMLMDRHSGPEELRADAAAALQEAFESGACTILQ